MVIALIMLVLIIDQWSKIYVKTNFFLGEEVEVFSWFRIHFLENEGMAFGFSLGENAGKLLLSILRIVAIVALGIFINHNIKRERSLHYVLSFALIMAGAIGNMLDSAFYGLIFSDSSYSIAEFMPEGGGYTKFLFGKVVDMLYFPLIEAQYPAWMPLVGGQHFLFFRPVFNIADSAISVGFVYFVIYHLIEGRRKYDIGK